MKRLFSFDGLLSRGELVLHLLLLAALMVGVGILLAIVRDVMSLSVEALQGLMGITNLAGLALLAGLAMRRFRDIGASPWWTATLLVPFVNLGAAAVLLFQPGWQDKGGIRHLLRALRVFADAGGVAGEAETERFRELLDKAMAIPPALRPAAVAEWSRTPRSSDELSRHLTAFTQAVASQPQLREEAMRLMAAMASAGNRGITPARAALLESAMKLLNVEAPLPPAIDAILGMAARMAKADGRIAEAHIKEIDLFLSQVLALPAMSRSRAIKLFNEAKASSTSFEQFAANFMTEYAGIEGARDAVFSLLLSLAQKDDTISAAEAALLDTAARILGINANSYDAHREWHSEQPGSQHGSSGHDERYYRSVLGVGAEATWEDIRKAYRSAMAKNHPDKVAGLSEAIRKVAETETQRLNEAYAYFESLHRKRTA